MFFAHLCFNQSICIQGGILAYARDWMRSFLSISVATVLTDGHSLSFTSDTWESEKPSNLMQSHSSTEQQWRHAPKASQFRVHFPHRPSAEAPQAKPILTALGSSKDGNSAQCDRCRTPFFKMDSRRSGKQHRRGKGECGEGDRQDNVCGQFFSGGFVWGNGDGTPGLLPARQAFCL